MYIFVSLRIHSFRFVSFRFFSKQPTFVIHIWTLQYCFCFILFYSRLPSFPPETRTITATAHPGLRTAIFFSWEEEPGADALAARSPFDPQPNRKAHVESEKLRSPGDQVDQDSRSGYTHHRAPSSSAFPARHSNGVRPTGALRDRRPRFRPRGSVAEDARRSNTTGSPRPGAYKRADRTAHRVAQDQAESVPELKFEDPTW